MIRGQKVMVDSDLADLYRYLQNLTVRTAEADDLNVKE